MAVLAGYTSLEHIKDRLMITESTYDRLLITLGKGVTEVVKRYCGILERATYTAELYDGDGEDTLYTDNRPIQSVSALVVQGITIPAAATYDQSGYMIDKSKRCIKLRDYVFTSGVQNVSLSYVAGYYLPDHASYVEGGTTSFPVDLEQAIIEMVGIKYERIDRGDIASESHGGHSVTYTDTDIPRPIKAVIDRYGRGPTAI